MATVPSSQAIDQSKKRKREDDILPNGAPMLAGSSSSSASSAQAQALAALERAKKKFTDIRDHDIAAAFVPDWKTPFHSMPDVVMRLLPFHVLNFDVEELETGKPREPCSYRFTCVAAPLMILYDCK
jgi:hypothetical protein